MSFKLSINIADVHEHIMVSETNKALCEEMSISTSEERGTPFQQQGQKIYCDMGVVQSHFAKFRWCNVQFDFDTFTYIN